MGQFWKDKQSQFDNRNPNTERFLYGWLVVLNLYLGLATAVILAVIFAIIARPLLYVWLALCLLMVVNLIRVGRRDRTEAAAVAVLQANAYRLTGASLMGSANHVAGHPGLERDQRVVLALTAGCLRIYGFAAPEPLDEIQGAAIRKLELVVYDDERIPHTDAIDPAAQALQITFDRGAGTSRCLLNRMIGHRPIDWFHALEKLRASSV
jgi:hypothetical protein